MLTRMNCKQFAELISEYIEMRMPKRQTRSCDRHLKVCIDCANYLDQMRRTIELTGRLSEHDIPAEALDELLAMFRVALVPDDSES